MKLLLIIFFLFLSACSINGKKDFIEIKPNNEKSHVTIYRPYNLKSGLANLVLSINGKDLALIKNQGHFTYEVQEGSLEISYQHEQDNLSKEDYQIVLTKIKKGQHLFYKIGLNTENGSVTSQAFGDLLASTVTVLGLAKVKDSPSLHKKGSRNSHTFIKIEKEIAINELKTCCTSERTKLLN